MEAEEDEGVEAIEMRRLIALRMLLMTFEDCQGFFQETPAFCANYEPRDSYRGDFFMDMLYRKYFLNETLQKWPSRSQQISGDF
jgi:hypothetical protein